MKKILIIGFILISLISYSKPIPVYVLRYKGEVLGAITYKNEINPRYTFQFQKNDMSETDLLNCLSSMNSFYIAENDVVFIYNPDLKKPLPKNITVIKEIYNFK